MSVWFILLELMHMEWGLLWKALAWVNILGSAWLMNDVLLMEALEEYRTNSTLFFFFFFFSLIFTLSQILQVNCFELSGILKTLSYDMVVKGATFPSSEFLFGKDKADVWLGNRLYLAWWQEVLRDLLLTFNPWCFSVRV